jgi:hypothetical protein
MDGAAGQEPSLGRAVAVAAWVAVVLAAGFTLVFMVLGPIVISLVTCMDSPRCDPWEGIPAWAFVVVGATVALAASMTTLVALQPSRRVFMISILAGATLSVGAGVWTILDGGPLIAFVALAGATIVIASAFARRDARLPA